MFLGTIVTKILRKTGLSPTFSNYDDDSDDGDDNRLKYHCTAKENSKHIFSKSL